MTIRWFLSGKVRQATESCKHVQKLVRAQKDILPQSSIDDVTAAIVSLQKAIDTKAETTELQRNLDALEKVANKNLRPYPNSEWRENVEVFLVAIAVAMAIRTFFLQPFKIPTGSMQPTLYGVTTENFRNKPEPFPSAWQKFVDACLHGTFYHHLTADQDCELVEVRHKKVLRFIEKHELVFRSPDGGAPWLKSVWFSPDERFQDWAELHPPQRFKRGEDVFKLKEVTGDHLFVDRLTYNFRRPRRGEIIVFKTEGIDRMSRQDQFYIKRLVALGGEHVRIGNDRHLVINGTRLDASTPHFENVYGFNGPPAKSQYSGHVNQFIVEQVDPRYRMFQFAPLFPDEKTEAEVRRDHYMVMGDNTMDSFDSRGWGDFSERNVIGKAFFVYWPISNHGGSRFGLGYR
jgi:signal peptidase I